MYQQYDLVNKLWTIHKMKLLHSNKKERPLYAPVWMNVTEHSAKKKSDMKEFILFTFI